MQDSDDKRYFSIDEVNGLVHRLSTVFGESLQLRAQLKVLYRELEKAGHAPTNDPTPDVEQSVPLELRRDWNVFYALAETLRERLESIAATGCVIKDLESGLFDWLALHHGREVWLCWKYGESEICYWHDHGDGFNGRRPVAELRDGAAHAEKH